MIRNDPLIVSILKEVRTLNLPNWYVGAGLVRTRIWDALHGYIGTQKESPIQEVDIVYYCKDENKFDKKILTQKLDAKIADIDWDLKNSAYLHKWYKEKLNMDIAPLTCVEEDIDCWPEVCTCVALRLLEDESLKIYAPWDVDDLLNMVFRRNTYKTRNVTPELFARRVISKKIKERWPKVSVIYE